EAIWAAAVGLYQTRTQPALTLCLRHRGEIILWRAIGHTRGNSPGEASGADMQVVSPRTPFCIFSASKAITAILMHELDARNQLRLSDPVAEYIPEFAQNGKEWVTLRHVLTHRAGIPILPPGYDPLALAHDWGAIIQLLCEAK